MQWLAEAVRRHGIRGEPESPSEYKRIYNQRLLVSVEKRLGELRSGEVTPDDLMIMGARNFLEELSQQGVLMYLASGTDHEYVLREASALGITRCFMGGIYGALDATEAHSKERIINRILVENNLRGSELVVVGDGPVEIRNAKSKDAIAVGVATDEVRRCGLNLRKRKRLIDAGSDLIIPDFTRHKKIIAFILGNLSEWK